MSRLSAPVLTARLPRRLRSGALAACMGALTLLAASPAAGAGASVRARPSADLIPASALARAVRVRPPANAASTSGGYLDAVACSGTGSCTAGGGYTDTSAASQAMVASSSGGTWARARELLMPAGANPDPGAVVSSVACPAAGSCVAVGGYRAGSVPREQGFAATQSQGTWRRARRLAMPANAGTDALFALHGISCTGIGSCVAVGSYTDTNGRTQALAVTESGGSWGTARELRMPAGAASDPLAAPSSVDCTRAGSCVATATYSTATGATWAALVTESGGTWHQASAVVLPAGAAADPQASFPAVTCTSTGNCLAVGEYFATGGSNYSFTVTQAAGTWAHARRFTLVPGNAALNPQVELRSVTCAQAGACVAVGGYLDTAGGRATLAAVMVKGRWAGATEVSPPTGAATGGLLNTMMMSVSCTAKPYCAAAGWYSDVSSRTEAMAANS